jgi:predicted nucleic acid-binding protein
VVTRYHLDTDFLIHALSRRGAERSRLRALLELGAEVEMLALAWYEFERGPRTPEQLAVGRAFLSPDGVLPFDEKRATKAAELYRSVTGSRRRGVDIALAACAIERDAVLLTGNARDYEGIEGLNVDQPR